MCSSDLDRPGLAAKIFGALSKGAIVVDVIVQDVPANGLVTVSFTVGKTDHLKARQVLEEIRRDAEFKDLRVVETAELAKVSIVGVGMQHHPGVASRMFGLLAEAGINIQLISTSDIRITCVVASAQVDDAVRALHEAFALDQA